MGICDMHLENEREAERGITEEIYCIETGLISALLLHKTEVALVIWRQILFWERIVNLDYWSYWTENPGKPGFESCQSKTPVM